MNFFKRKAAEETNCLASTSAYHSSPPGLPVETIKSSPEGVAENENISFFHDSADSFFCTYFGGSAVSNTDESTKEISHMTVEANEDEPEPSESTELDNFLPMERCPECDCLVAIVDVPEHADYHAAYKLHQELNGTTAERNSVAAYNVTAPVASNKIARSWTHSSATRGKSKKLIRMKSDPVAAKNQPITYFFHAKQHPQ